MNIYKQQNETHFLRFLGIVCLMLCSLDQTHACGTVEGGGEVYLDTDHPNHSEALYMIHCQPIVLGTFSAYMDQSCQKGWVTRRLTKDARSN
jgi:hypothetical protein